MSWNQVNTVGVYIYRDRKRGEWRKMEIKYLLKNVEKGQPGIRRNKLKKEEGRKIGAS